MDEIITPDQCYENFTSGINCCMTVFGECAAALGFSREDAYKIGSGFGGGMGISGTCGCVTGALMALGLKYGVSGPGQAEKEAEYKEKRKEYYKAFMDKVGTYNCTEILENLNPADPAEKAMIIEKGLMRSKCAEIAAFAVETLAEIMDI